jgi:hypothetical protein
MELRKRIYENFSFPFKKYILVIIQAIKIKEVYTGPGLDAQQQAHPVGRQQRDRIHPLNHFFLQIKNR